MSVLSEIERLEGAKNALAASIEGKGVTVPTGTKIDGMAALVDQISTGGGADFYIDDASYLFYNGARQEAFDSLIHALRNVKTTKYMFGDCQWIRHFDFSKIDMSAVTNTDSMFLSSMLETVSTAEVNTSNVTRMYYMFGVTRIQEIDLSSFDTSNVTSMSRMFERCNLLKHIDMSSLDTTKVSEHFSMFIYCNKLEDIINFSGIGATGQSETFPRGSSQSSKSALKRLTFKTNLPDGQYAIRSQIDIRYCSFDEDGMVEMFNTLPDISGLTLNENYKKITITGNPCVTDGTLTDEDKAIAIGKGWTIVI